MTALQVFLVFLISSCDSSAASNKATLQSNQSESVEEFLSNGRSRAESRDYKGAIEFFTRAIKIDPKNVDAFKERGLARVLVGEFKNAISDYSAVITIDPKDRQAYIGRSAARARLQDFEGAIADCTKAIEIDPERADGFYNRGLLSYQSGRYVDAVSDYNEAVKRDPEDPATYNNRGLAKYKLSDFKGAIEDCTRALEIRPKYARAFLNRGLARAASGLTDDAIKDLGSAIEADASYVSAYDALANAQFNKRMWKESSETSLKAIELGSTIAPHHQLRLFVVRERLGEREKATRELSSYLETAKDNPNFSKTVMLLLEKITVDKFVEALKLDDATTDKQTKTMGFLYIGLLSTLKENRTDAIKYFKQAVDIGLKTSFDYQTALSELKAIEGRK